MTVVKIDKIIGGGQALGVLDNGKKVMVWGALPGEVVDVQLTKNKRNYAEGYATEILQASPLRIEPRDNDSYLSTSPWQIVSIETENLLKQQLIAEAFEMHDVELDGSLSVYTDGVDYEYRNKVEFSFWFDTDAESLSLAFFRRGTHGKIPVNHTSLAHPEINRKATEILDILNNLHVTGRQLKMLLIRASQTGETAWQLYIKDDDPGLAQKIASHLTDDENYRIIFSNPKSPASVITKVLVDKGQYLTDELTGVNFRYAVDGFFQINLPVYEQALRDMQDFVLKDTPLLDMYSGVGTIGLTIGRDLDDVRLVEVNEVAVAEMTRNIANLGSGAKAILSSSEDATAQIDSNMTLILDPPRAGLHDVIIQRIIEQKPKRILYLSCNPVTQARDIAKLSDIYKISFNRGYNFFPHTPHIENLVVLNSCQAR